MITFIVSSIKFDEYWYIIKWAKHHRYYIPLFSNRRIDFFSKINSSKQQRYIKSSLTRTPLRRTINALWRLPQSIVMGIMGIYLQKSFLTSQTILLTVLWAFAFCWERTKKKRLSIIHKKVKSFQRTVPFALDWRFLCRTSDKEQKQQLNGRALQLNSIWIKTLD